MEKQNMDAYTSLLRRRSRLRWSLTGVLVSLYLAYGLLGIEFKEAYGARFFDSALSWGLVCGFIIMALSVVFSLVYVRVSNGLDTCGEEQ